MSALAGYTVGRIYWHPCGQDVTLAGHRESAYQVVPVFEIDGNQASLCTCGLWLSIRDLYDRYIPTEAELDAHERETAEFVAFATGR